MWHTDPKQRPTFTDIIDVINNLLAPTEKAIDVKETIELGENIPNEYSVTELGFGENNYEGSPIYQI